MLLDSHLLFEIHTEAFPRLTRRRRRRRRRNPSDFRVVSTPLRARYVSRMLRATVSAILHVLRKRDDDSGRVDRVHQSCAGAFLSIPPDEAHGAVRGVVHSHIDVRRVRHPDPGGYDQEIQCHIGCMHKCRA